MAFDKCESNLRGKDDEGNRRIGKCQRPAGWGTQHAGFGQCKLHGGNTKNANISGSAEVLKRDVDKILGKLDITPIDDPLTELSKLAGEVTAWKNIIAERVAFLKDVSYEGEKTGEQIKGEVIVFERALDRCNTVLVGMARLNIDDRLARISEMQAQLVADALAAVLGEMGMDLGAQREAKTRVAEKLRLAVG
jgi:hypothetical protein